MKKIGEFIHELIDLEKQYGSDISINILRIENEKTFKNSRYERIFEAYMKAMNLKIDKQVIFYPYHINGISVCSNDLVNPSISILVGEIEQ